MKKLPKYKIYLKSRKIVNLFPQKIKYFHRNKWKLIIKQKKFFYIKRYKFKNFFFCKFAKGKRKFIRMKKFYKECILTKNQLLQNFDNSFNLRLLKKDFSSLKTIQYAKIVKFTLVKQIFFLNILLWKLSFFVTSDAASSYINNNFVYVNGKNVNSNYFLKLGDIIEFKDLSFLIKLRSNLNRYKYFSRIYSFVEIDYYSCNLVIVKDYNNFILDDLSLLFSKPININYLFNLLR